MKAILISQRLVSTAHSGDFRCATESAWGTFFSHLNLFPVPLLHGFPIERTIDALDVAGVLLSGGNDLGCVSDDPLSLLRDQFERMLLEWAVARGIPILGVCRGMQLICWYFGSRIGQVAGHVACRHDVTVSRTAKFVSTEEVRRSVNSFHSFGVLSLPSVLSVVAETDDGDIEAVEHNQARIVGVMWHPEREPVPCSSDVALFQRLFNAS